MGTLSLESRDRIDVVSPDAKLYPALKLLFCVTNGLVQRESVGRVGGRISLSSHKNTTELEILLFNFFFHFFFPICFLNTVWRMEKSNP